MIWYPVLEGWGSLVEVQTRWTLDDCLDAIEAGKVRMEEEYLRSKAITPKKR